MTAESFDVHHIQANADDHSGRPFARMPTILGQNMCVAQTADGRFPLTWTQPSPFLEVERSVWAMIADAQESPLTEQEITQIRGLGDKLDLREVSEVYLPLSRMLSLYVEERRGLQGRVNQLLASQQATTPFVIGIAGSVAVGESTVSRLLRELLSRWESTPKVALVTTDGFLYPNDELERRGLLDRKGFPESYDRRALLRFVASVKGGAESVAAPVYSHQWYDIIPGESIAVSRPDVLIVEGLNVLQPPQNGGLAVSDFFDFSIYVDARVGDIETWYVDRLIDLKHEAFSRPDSYFHRWAKLSDEEVREIGRATWRRVNEPNLVEYIAPTKSRADVVLRKAANHAVHSVLIRKL